MTFLVLCICNPAELADISLFASLTTFCLQIQTNLYLLSIYLKSQETPPTAIYLDAFLVLCSCDPVELADISLFASLTTWFLLYTERLGRRLWTQAVGWRNMGERHKHKQHAHKHTSTSIRMHNTTWGKAGTQPAQMTHK